MKVCVFVFSAGLFFAAMAAQNVGNVTVSRDAGRRLMTVSYTLAEPGIVTVAFKRDGVAIPEARFANVAGDVNKYVAATGEGQTHTIRWQTDQDWPEMQFDGAVSAEVTAWSTNNPPDYAVFDLAVATGSVHYAGVRFYVSTNALPGGLQDRRYRVDKLLMRKIPAAGVVWRMGSPDGETGRSSDETRHRVKLKEDYYMAVFETTYGQSEYMYSGTTVAGGRLDNSGTKDPAYALGSVMYSHLRDKTDVGLAARENPNGNLVIGSIRRRTGVKFDIPTEAQWEFACRAGTGTPFYNGYSLPNTSTLTSALLREIGWIYYKTGTIAEDGNTYGPRPVGMKKPNSFGLYDMVGNVSEFCFDSYGDYSVEDDDGISVNPIGAVDSSTDHVLRGGYFSSSAGNCRSAKRTKIGGDSRYSGYGFRLVCPVTLY